MTEILEMKPKDSVSFPEQETIVTSAPVDGKIAYVYTCVPKDLRRMWKLYSEHPDEVSIYKDDKYSTEFIVPSSWVKIRPKRKVSDEQREAAAQRLAAYRAHTNNFDDEDDDPDEEVED